MGETGPDYNPERDEHNNETAKEEPLDAEQILRSCSEMWAKFKIENLRDMAHTMSWTFIGGETYNLHERLRWSSLEQIRQSKFDQIKRFTWYIVGRTRVDLLSKTSRSTQKIRSQSIRDLNGALKTNISSDSEKDRETIAMIDRIRTEAVSFIETMVTDFEAESSLGETLLRPSTGPDSANDDLLRPASGKAKGDDGTLLHPTETTNEQKEE